MKSQRNETKETCEQKDERIRHKTNKKKLNGLKPYPSSNTFKNKNKNLGVMKILKGKDNKNEGNQARSASVGRAKFNIKVCSAKGISF